DEGFIGAMHALLDLQPVEHKQLFAGKPQGLTLLLSLRRPASADFAAHQTKRPPHVRVATVRLTQRAG
ncbi:MAG: hypothetical protein QMD17_11995, partial [Rhodocyclaceae bacterium]|nr:hypothetical protein [Rhodocyclaceae bacterium]